MVSHLCHESEEITTGISFMIIVVDMIMRMLNGILSTPHTWSDDITISICQWHYYTLRTTKLLGGILVSLRPSVCPSVRLSVRLSRLPCPLCNIYSSGWILSILATNYHYHERVCRTQWPLTLTYIFKVIRPWLRKPCPLCSIYSSQWILFIFGTDDHYY